MFHIMLDAYGAYSERLDNMRSVYEVIHKITAQLSLTTVMPTVVVPYYYGTVKEDDGISAFVLLKGGHFTIHTFPQRECYFVDVLYDGFVSEDKLIDLLSHELPFEKKILNSVDRRFKMEQQCEFNKIDSDCDFGPHYLIKTKNKHDWNMEDIFHFLDALPAEINMSCIMRPVVVTDKIEDYTIISGITVIAQSHIAVHYFKNENIAYIDIFSCSFVSGEMVNNEIKRRLKSECEIALISRGGKHAHKLAQRSDVIARYDTWLKNIL